MNKMTKKTFFALLVFISISVSYSYGQIKHNGFKSDAIATAELKEWHLHGVGEVSTWGGQVSLKETDKSKGVMLISPESFKDDVILNFNVLALTPATVIVAMLSVSDKGISDELTIPENYNGSIGLWMKEKESYFMAFKNASHNKTPFLRKNPDATKPLVAAKENYMVAGVYYNIEVGKKQGKLWLSIDGKKVFETHDAAPLKGGHVALRLRGTAGFPAGCLIKDLVIASK
jgi:hypothetical protein